MRLGAAPRSFFHTPLRTASSKCGRRIPMVRVTGPSPEEDASRSSSSVRTSRAHMLAIT